MSTNNRQSNQEPLPSPAADPTRVRYVTVTIILSLLAVPLAAVFAISPLRENLSWASRPETNRIQQELRAALDQVYRSFELDDEVAAYNQIAKGVTGDAIRDIYLEVRQSWLGEDGERVLIDQVQVDEIGDIQWQPDGGCSLDATWSVRGHVGHFGHSHERQNQYRARIEMLPQDKAWKIRSIHISEYEREW